MVIDDMKKYKEYGGSFSVNTEIMIKDAGDVQINNAGITSKGVSMNRDGLLQILLSKVDYEYVINR